MAIQPTLNFSVPGSNVSFSGLFGRDLKTSEMVFHTISGKDVIVYKLVSSGKPIPFGNLHAGDRVAMFPTKDFFEAMSITELYDAYRKLTMGAANASVNSGQVSLSMTRDQWHMVLKLMEEAIEKTNSQSIFDKAKSLHHELDTKLVSK